MQNISTVLCSRICRSPLFRVIRLHSFLPSFTCKPSLKRMILILFDLQYLEAIFLRLIGYFIFLAMGLCIRTDKSGKLSDSIFCLRDSVVKE